MSGRKSARLLAKGKTASFSYADHTKISKDEAYEPHGKSPSSGSDFESSPEGKRKPHMKATLPNKKARRAKGPKNSIAPAAVTTLHSPVLRLAPSPKTRYLNKWLEISPKLRVKENVSPNAVSTTQLTPLGDLPDMKGRQFKYDIELVELDVSWDPVEGEDKQVPRFQSLIKPAIDKHLKKIKTWRIFVWNDALEKEQQRRLRLFPEPRHVQTHIAAMRNHERAVALKNRKKDVPPPIPFPYDYYRFGGPLDINVCPDEAAASRVAAEACRLLNKYPEEIHDADFPDAIGFRDVYGRTGMRSLIELMAMMKIHEKFDFRSLRYLFRSSSHVGGTYFLDLPTGARPTGYNITVPVFTLGPRRDYRGKWPDTWFVYKKITEAAVDELPDAPSWWGLMYTSPKNKSPDTSSHGPLPMEKAQKLCRYFSWKVFGHIGTREAILMAPPDVFNKSSRQTRRSRGPFKGQVLFKACPKRNSIRVSRAVAEAIDGSVPTIHHYLRPAVVALALQSAYEVFIQNKGIIQVLQELFIAVDELNLGVSILSPLNYCRCGDDVDRKRATAHHCMYCLKLRICSEMAWTPDGRLVCRQHLKIDPFASDKFLERAIEVRVSDCERHYGRQLSSDRRVAMKKVLIDQYTLPGNRFLDTYNGERVYIHPRTAFSFSLEAVFPLWKAGDSFFVHHEQNVGLTTLFTNLFKGEDIPMVLALASHAMEIQGQGKFLSDIECMFDHCHRIRLVVPRGIALRIEAAKQQDQSWWPLYLQMMRKGIYDNTKPIYEVDWSTCSLRWIESWGDAIVARLDKICKEIESSPKYNPRGLKLPRSPKSGAPWLWNPNHMFDNHDWDHLATLFRIRFTRMDRICDMASDHEHESSQTLFLTCVILWFQLDGGKDEILGLRMTVHKRHALRFSIGRALHVAPGSVMATGWSKKYASLFFPFVSASSLKRFRYPTSLSQYDDSRRTITMETWMMNR